MLCQRESQPWSNRVSVSVRGTGSMAYSAGVTSGSFRLEARELDHLVPLLVFEATGARLRSVPFTPAKVKVALGAA
jgi:hypothetical protein